MRPTALLLALVFQILPLHFWSGLIYCLHPDGRGFVVSPEASCCQPPDAGATHCGIGSDADGTVGASLAAKDHCEDLPLTAKTLALRSELRSALEIPAGDPTAATGDIGAPAPHPAGLRAGFPVIHGASPPFALSRLASVVLRC